MRIWDNLCQSLSEDTPMTPLLSSSVRIKYKQWLESSAGEYHWFESFLWWVQSNSENAKWTILCIMFKLKSKKKYACKYKANSHALQASVQKKLQKIFDFPLFPPFRLHFARCDDVECCKKCEVWGIVLIRRSC